MRNWLGTVFLLCSSLIAKTGLHYDTFSATSTKVEASLFYQCNPLQLFEGEHFLDDQNPLGQITLSLKLRGSEDNFYNVIQFGTGGAILYVLSLGGMNVPIWYTSFSRYYKAERFLTGVSVGIVRGNVYNDVEGGLMVHLTPSFYFELSPVYALGIRVPLCYITYEEEEWIKSSSKSYSNDQYLDVRTHDFLPSIEIENSIGNEKFRVSLMVASSLESATCGVSLLWNFTSGL